MFLCGQFIQEFTLSVSFLLFFSSSFLYAQEKTSDIVHHALVLTLTADKNELHTHLTEKKNLLPEDLLDNLAFLEHATPTSSSKEPALSGSLRLPYPPDPGLASSLQKIRCHAQSLRIKKLKKEHTYNQVTEYFNGIVQHASHFLTGNPEAGLDMLLKSLFIGSRNAAPSPREKKIHFVLSRYQQNLELSLSADKMQELFNTLEQKMDRHLFKSLLYNGNRQTDVNDLLSLFYYERAQAIIPSPAVEKRIARISASLSTDRRARTSALTVVPGDDVYLPDAPRSGYAHALCTMIAGHNTEATETLSRLVSLDVPPGLASSIALAQLMVSERSGYTESTRKAFMRLARRHRRTLDGKRAFAFAFAPSAHPRIRYLDVCEEARIHKWNMAFLDRRPEQPGEYFSEPASTAVSRTIASVLNVFPFPSTLLRWLSVALDTSYTRNATIDAQIQYARFEPDSLSPEMMERIAVHFEKETEFEKAAHYYRLAGKYDEKKQSDLVSKEASTLFSMASQIENPSLKKKYMRVISGQYPETGAGRKAARLFASFPDEDDALFTLTRENIYRYPFVNTLAGECLSPELVDGSQSNDELTEEGIRVRNNQTISYATIRSREEMTIECDAHTMTHLTYALREARAIEAAEQGRPDHPIGIVPFEISGDIGADTLSLYPSLKQYPADSRDLRLFK